MSWGLPWFPLLPADSFSIHVLGISIAESGNLSLPRAADVLQSLKIWSYPWPMSQQQ
jgi:hypothetical protein